MSVPIHKLKKQHHNGGGRGPGGNRNNNNNNNNNNNGNNNRNNGGGNNNRNNNRNNNHDMHKKDMQKQQPGDSRNVLRTMLKLVFEKQAQIMFEGGVLHLASFRDCPDLAAVKSSIDFDTTGFCDCLCAVIREVIPDVQFLRVDQNHIRNMNMVVDSLIKHGLHMNIRGISANDNKISDLSFINKLARFKNLVEVSFTNNPMAQKGDYRARLSKRLPQLMGIDGTGIERHPLTLPWPLPATYSDEQQRALQWIEQFLAGLGSQGPDHVGFTYAVEALFSLNVPVELSFSHKTDSKPIQAAVQEMRAKVKDHNRNLVQVTGNTSAKVAKGRSEVCVALTSCVYPRGFMVEHKLDSNADVIFVNEADGLLPAMAIATLHGVMTWHHPQYRIVDPSNPTPRDDRPLQFCFDRTFVLMFRDQDWCIISDMLTLRDRAVSAIFMGNSVLRVEPLAAKTGLPPEVVAAILNASSNDTELTQALNEVAAIGPEVLGECSVATADPTFAIHMARVIANCNVTTAAAFAVVSQSGGDLLAAITAAQQLPADAYRS